MTTHRATIHFPPTQPTLTLPSLILFGTIQPSPTHNWATHLSTTLLDLPIQILNPRRDDWDATWREDVSFAPFRENVEWEMAHAEKASLIVICFKAGSLCPISLLELGMHAARFGERVVVCCEDGFYKRGNVEIVCARFGVVCVRTVGELERAVREWMEGLCDGEEGRK
ncbi:hypothetical protein BU23DRAFT_550467 [Bimuria novae-zelandiae CBS 107.79]|uniref:Nucleoside 2-deoxyribosyltransferase domain-containing protein n=1 Tax=Bimuria novae-zelandiae CBS 107.79 TaxID=1447943 RepID=A0A6A5VKH6_9PLEO|nr:hypothetical protein BU23DRAFT_550467 [Bimuria novae-zelandiae CBS 107.79]